MSEIRHKIDEVVDNIRAERDELRLQLNLAQAEAKDEWAALERKWQQLEARAKRVKDTARDSSGDVGAAAEQLAEEIARGYRRLRNAMR